nr:MAG TPA: hypothetical protein [Caudoviricetes sp.]
MSLSFFVRGRDFYFHLQKCKNILLHFHVN